MQSMLSIGKEKISDSLNVTRSELTSADMFSAIGNEISKDLKDYKAEVEDTIAYNLSILDELPTLRNLNLDELKTHFKELMSKDIRKDAFFEKSVEIKKYTHDLSKHLLKYFQEVFEYQVQKKEKLNSRLFDLCRLFYNSDLPLQYLKASENAILIQRDFVDIYTKRLHREHVDLMNNRNNDKKFGRICDEHNRWIRPLNEKTKAINRLWLKILWYIDFGNSLTVNDIFKIKAIKSDCLDMQVIESLTNQLNLLVEKLDAILDSCIEFTPFASYEGKEGARAIRKIMELLNTKEEG